MNSAPIGVNVSTSEVAVSGFGINGELFGNNGTTTAFLLAASKPSPSTRDRYR